MLAGFSSIFNNVKSLVFVLILIISLSFPLGSVSAKGGTTLSPLDANLVLKPGETTTVSFELKNNESIKSRVKLDVGVRVKDEIKVEDLAANGENSWIHFDEREFSIDSGKSKEVKFDVKVPISVKEGTYTPVVVIKINSDTTASSSSGSSITENFLFNLFISVNESGRNSGQVIINKFETGSSFLINNNQSFDIEIMNNSTSDFINPIAYFQVINPKGEIIYQETINDNFSPLAANEVLAESKQVSLKSSIDDIGNYTAQLLVLDQNTNRSQFQEVEFFVLPYIFLLYGATVFVVIVILALAFTNKRGKKVKYKRLKT